MKHSRTFLHCFQRIDTSAQYYFFFFLNDGQSATAVQICKITMVGILLTDAAEGLS